MYLGSDETQNVFEAEVAAIKMAVDMARNTSEMYRECNIYADSLSAITATVKPVRQSGQSTIMTAISSIEALQRKNPSIRITITWVPGHRGIEGNDIADREAKKAATDNEIRRTSPKRDVLKASRHQRIKNAARDEWDKAMSKLRQGHRSEYLTRHTVRSQASNIQAQYKQLRSRIKVSRLAALRTGHCQLNSYLHRFNIIDTPLCECESGAVESVEHYLLLCSRYDRERAKLARNVGVTGMRVEKLLGRPEHINHALEYVEDTQRLKY
jgi:ribonuclease HI